LLKNLPVTPVATLERAKAICDAEGLHYVYVGNVPGHPAEKTHCPKCRRVVVDRQGYLVSAVNLVRGRCRFCQQPVAGVWS
jgi:pyruvate formate lyase activating enzyme